MTPRRLRLRLWRLLQPALALGRAPRLRQAAWGLQTRAKVDERNDGARVRGIATFQRARTGFLDHIDQGFEVCRPPFNRWQSLGQLSMEEC